MYESGEQQPVLAVAVRLAGALGVTVNELAGLPSERVQLEGTWWAAWQTFNEGQELIATSPSGSANTAQRSRSKLWSAAPRTNAAATSGAANCACGTGRS
jgi:hypothetical protein